MTSRAIRMMALVLGLAGAGAGAGCNWSKFANEAEKAPVRSIGAPSGFDSADFGKSILPLSSGQGSAAAFVASSLNESHLVLVKIERSGSVKSYAVTSSQLADTVGSAITSLAEVPGSAPTRLLLGTPVVKSENFGRMYTFDLPSVEQVALGMSPVGSELAKTYAVPSLGSADSGLGRGLATGFLTGGALPDFIVGSDNEVAVVVDGVASAMTPASGLPIAACDVAYDYMQDNRYLVRRPMMAASLWADPAAPGAQQLVLGITRSGVTPGKVEFLNMTAAGAFNCLAVESPAGAKPQFGHALATGDFDADGNLDLLVGAPGQQAFVYRNFAAQPLGTVPPPIPISMPTGVDFGYAVAALNIDGVAGDEALISDPRAPVDGQDGAGHVLAYAFNPGTVTMDLREDLHDLAPEAQANFGYSVNALTFCQAEGGVCPAGTAAHVLLVGAANEVFLYYRVGDIPLQPGQTAPDVRTP